MKKLILFILLMNVMQVDATHEHVTHENATHKDIKNDIQSKINNDTKSSDTDPVRSVYSNIVNATDAASYLGNVLANIEGSTFVMEGTDLGSIAGGSDFITATDNLHVIASNITTLARSSEIAAIEGSSFNPLTDSLHVLSTNILSMQATLALLVAQFADPITRVNVAVANGALQVTVTTTDGAAAAALTAYNTSLSAALTAVEVAVAPATQNNANTVLAQTAVATATTRFHAFAVLLNTHHTVVSSQYSSAEISAALAQLTTALASVLSNQPTS